MHRVLTDDNDLAGFGRAAVVACARDAFAACASQLAVVRLVGVALAHPSYAFADRAIVFHEKLYAMGARSRRGPGGGECGTVQGCGGRRGPWLWPAMKRASSAKADAR
jgi:hypothetical protein